jgi:probable rRNA maturation factor
MSPSDELVSFRRVPAGLRRAPLHEFARSLRNEVARGRQFHCLITDDRELRRLNRQFLGHNYPTDVLSFPLDEDAGMLGEIAISAGRAAEQAREFGHSQLDEIRILMLHGMLHLMGMDHEADRGAMARAETRWRKKLQLPAGLIARARS